MKPIILVCFCVALVSCEIPRYNTLRFQRVKQAPYPTAGYPEGPDFPLPGEYGPASYGPPQENMPPEATTQSTEEMVTESITETSTAETEPTESNTTTEYEVNGESAPEKEMENEENAAKSQRLTDGVKSEGVYYVLSPSGFLQRVVYGDRKDSVYAAQIRHQNLEVEEPLYLYNPQAYYLQPVQF